MGANFDFPYRVEQIDELPSQVREKLKQGLSAGEKPLHMFAMPRQRDWFQMALGLPAEYSYFFLTDRQILVIHDLKKGLRTESCLISSLAYFEIGTVLLNSWLRFVPSPDSNEKQIKLPYNTVFGREIRSAAICLRALTLGLQNQPERIFEGIVGLELIRSLPLKFNNMSREYWLKDEAALSVAFVPAIWVPRLRYFRRVYSFATALILTDKQLLIVTEQGVEGSAGKYGETWMFCPLTHIRQLSVGNVLEYPLGLFQLGVGPSTPSETINIPFPPESEHDIRDLAGAVDRLRQPSALAR